MAGLIDVFSLLFATAFFVGAIVGVIVVVRKLSAAVDSTKASLKEKGWTISDKGVSVKTSKRLNREDYIDATQRGLMKAMNASTYGSANSTPNASPNPNIYTSKSANSSATNVADASARRESNASESGRSSRGMHLRRKT